MSSRPDSIGLGIFEHALRSGLQALMEQPWVAAVTDAAAAADFVTGSGLPAIGSVYDWGKAIALSLIYLLAIWVIIAEIRAWGAERGDSFDLIITIVRASALPLIGVLVLTLF